MAVTILKRPQGHILDSTVRDALVTDDYGNQGALFDDPSHGLVDGDYIYVSSNISNYNGFWYVDIVNSRFFWVREYPTKARLAWIVDAVVNYQKSAVTHGWSCVHLPIIYKLSNDRWPVNSIDTSRTISSVIDNNGYCELSLSGDIKSSGNADELDYVKVSTGTLAGVYQIMQWVSDTNFVINVLYSAANDTALTGATIQYYYNNYNIRVRVFVGLSSSHYFTALKPYVQVVDLKLVPDQSGIIDVNINEYLKNHIEVLTNNLELASLPNDIDSLCQFYISTAETFDITDGESLTTSTPSFTSDAVNFEGVAVNLMLQFKNRFSGYLSEYVANNSSSQFLTLFSEPRLFSGCYYDISFLNPGGDSIYVRNRYYSNSVLQSTVNTLINSYGLGQYRCQISELNSYDQVLCNLYTSLGITNLDCTGSGWSNLTAGLDIDWTSGTETPPPYSFVNLHSGGTGVISSEYWGISCSPVVGVTYTISLNFILSLTINSRQFTIVLAFLDSSDNVIVQDEFTSTAPVGDTSYAESFVLTPPASATQLGIRITKQSGSGNFICSLETGLSGAGVGDVTISETKTINIDNECSFQDIYLTWKNYLGGMDYWKFTAQKEYITSIENVTESTKNIYPTWPTSYGEFADTIERDTSRDSRDKILVRSQNVTEDELNAIRYIVSSPLVQIMVTRNNRRTVQVDPGSFTWKRDEDKLYAIEFEIKYTNMIPSQSL